ncbi:flagellar basal body rod protein FlgB [Planococcus salinus]|uniref:Flagellar basal body rod protein FlgB n=1 Tax=Planococcus salinus TaxID=1848460 RepID=A0A3M8P645_9BACL|nr:flagellar basal body rod protein FlgB [Planococcus salinus]RNF38760.1 flagellar basal body rod protein FlgB [Planococcus salinus]
MKLFTPTVQSLENALSTATLRQKVHSSNIANVDTPNYKSKRVDFQSALNQAMDQQPLASHKTNPHHIPFSNENTQFAPEIKVNNTTKYQNNGNNVDMDLEMAELAKNQLWYNAVTERINGKFGSLRSVINEGR